MSTHIFRNTSTSDIYQKAQEILHLSKHISSYFNQDLAPLKINGEENTEIYFSGDIVQQSVRLGPQILKAENELFQDDKYRYADSVRRLTNLLYKNCHRLSRTNSNGKDFLPILIKEIQRFKKLYRTWMLTL